MNPSSVLQTVNRLGSRSLGRLDGAARLVTRTALDNARRAAQEIAGLVAERRVLAGSLDEPSPAAGDLARLTPAQCRDLLTTRSIGRLAYVARAGVPDIVPVNYVRAGGALFVRTAAGPKLQAAERREVVAFEVDEIDEISHTGWSVVVTGRAGRITAAEAARTGGPAPSPWARGPRRHTIRIAVERLDGRRLL